MEREGEREMDRGKNGRAFWFGFLCRTETNERGTPSGSSNGSRFPGVVFLKTRTLPHSRRLGRHNDPGSLLSNPRQITEVGIVCFN